MTHVSPECRTQDARGASRASFFLAAALFSDGAATPVKIRNMSATGALVEAAVSPRQGALVQLVRGELIVHGLVVWAGDHRCGLKFSGSVDVERWRAAPRNGEQERVDEIVRLVKAGTVPLPVRPLAHPSEPGGGPEGEGLSDDLRRVSGLLGNLGSALAGDREMVARHGPALQNLDIAMQVLAAVEALIAGRDEASPDDVRLAGLRRSADQALRSSGPPG